MRPLGPPHSGQFVDAPPGAASEADLVEAALSRDHVTLTYGERCFELTRTVEAGGKCFLRFTEVGRLAATGSGPAVLVFASGGYRAEQRIAPCQDAWDKAVLREIAPDAPGALGGALRRAAVPPSTSTGAPSSVGRAAAAGARSRRPVPAREAPEAGWRHRRGCTCTLCRAAA